VTARALAAALILWLSVACDRPEPPPAPPEPVDARPTMVAIPAGAFRMGAPATEPGRHPDETTRQVTISRPFLLAQTEVTREQWRAVMGEADAAFPQCGVDCPMASITWLEAVAFCNALSEREGLPRCYAVAGREVSWDRACSGYRLPTEAEWEYAARAGENGGVPGGDISTLKCRHDPLLDAVAWYCGNSRVTYPGCFDARAKWDGAACAGPHPVAQKAANAWGLHDMLGNSWEWVWDRHGPYPTEPSIDPLGPETGEFRVLRGGSWLRNARVCRFAVRNFYSPDQKHYHGLGLRPARSLPEN